MKNAFALAVAAVLALWVAASPTLADNGRPSVQKPLAERYSYGILREFASWRYKDFGFVDCNQGKINRYTWACRAGWGQGHLCHRGRVQIYGTYRESGINHYGVHFRGERAYRCVGN